MIPSIALATKARNNSYTKTIEVVEDVLEENTEINDNLTTLNFQTLLVSNNLNESNED